MSPPSTGRIIDLTLPIEPHFRWPVSTRVAGDLTAGDVFQVTTLETSVHAFTHVDAQRHFIAHGPTIECLDLDTVVGPCDVLDLSDVDPEEAIDATRLERAALGRDLERRLLLRTCWHQRRSIDDPAFWRDAPYVTRDGAQWLLARAPTCVAFDFPQDWTIRRLLDGEIRPKEEHVTHDVLLRAGVTLVEYLTNTAAIETSRIWLCAAPLRIVGADGAPARIFAIV